jgi:hypothetical protein
MRAPSVSRSGPSNSIGYWRVSLVSKRLLDLLPRIRGLFSSSGDICSRIGPRMAEVPGIVEMAAER